MADIAKRLKGLDIFPKTLDDFRVRTTSGGIVSMVTFSTVVVLVISEIVRFLSPETHTTLSVETARTGKLQVHLDIDFPHINCEILGVDAHDQAGNFQIEIENHLYKTPIFPDGTKKQPHHTAAAEPERAFKLRRAVGSVPPNYCGSCYGAEEHEGACCNTCDEVKKAYESKGWRLSEADNVEQCVREGVNFHVTNEYRVGEGCNIRGYIEIAKVAGNFHIAPGHTFELAGRQMHDMSAFRGRELDVSHKINSLSFGERFPKANNPLDHDRKTQHRLGMYEYFLKVVPTVYRSRWGKTVVTNQYSVTEYFRESDPNHGGRLLPGVFFFYDMSPIKVEIEQRRRSFFHFLVQLCAIVGGIFTVSGMIDSGIHHGAKLMRKNQLGKAD